MRWQSTSTLGPPAATAGAAQGPYEHSWLHSARGTTEKAPPGSGAKWVTILLANRACRLREEFSKPTTSTSRRKVGCTPRGAARTKKPRRSGAKFLARVCPSRVKANPPIHYHSWLRSGDFAEKAPPEGAGPSWSRLSHEGCRREAKSSAASPPPLRCMDDETVRTVRQNVFDNFQSNSRYRDFITARDALTAARSLLVRIMKVDETLAETRSLQRQRRGYVTAMPPRRTSKKDSPAKLAGRMKRRWRVVLLRARAKFSARSRHPMWHRPRQPQRSSLIWTKFSATGSWCRNLPEAGEPPTVAATGAANPAG